jgi:hypothetical protein
MAGSVPRASLGCWEVLFLLGSSIDIVEMVAAMTEDDPGVGVKKLIDNSIPG